MANNDRCWMTEILVIFVPDGLRVHLPSTPLLTSFEHHRRVPIIMILPIFGGVWLDRISFTSQLELKPFYSDFICLDVLLNFQISNAFQNGRVHLYHRSASILRVIAGAWDRSASEATQISNVASYKIVNIYFYWTPNIIISSTAK